MSASDELKAHLLVIAEHARDALALIEAGAMQSISLPKGSTACLHPHRQEGMGGWWTCLDCGAKWHE